jgi:predicted SprT family Zn-dependent metalloprotease
MNRSDAARLARALMNEHGLGHWSFQFDNAKRRFGVCRHSTRQIGLSAALVGLNDEDRVRNTILHEIAHALVGPEHGHDRVWRAKAIELGCDGKRCYESTAVEAPPAPWTGHCPTPECDFTVGRHRLTEAAKRGACPKCCRGRFNPDYRLVWKRTSRKVAA